jgi:penicillin-binding protein 2
MPRYPPGSTFKPVVAAAALQQGVVTPTSQILDPGYFIRGGRTFFGWFRPGFGNQNMVQAIAHSDDIYFYTVADKLGDLVLGQYARDFGVGHRTGIDLSPEAAGIAPDQNWKRSYFARALQQTGDPAWGDSTWYEGDTITYGIGQSFLLVTPLQDLAWTATVANGGAYLQPQLTGRVTSTVGGVVRPFAPVVEHRVKVSSQVLDVVRQGLRATVAFAGGTASLLRDLPDAGAKTGTAQYGTPDAQGNTPTHAWFTAIAPVSNPEVAVVVFIEGGGEGSTYAEPAAEKILQYYFAHRNAIRAH